MTEKTTAAPEPSTTPAPEGSSAAAETTTTTPAAEAEGDALFREMADKSNARLAGQEKHVAPLPPDPEDGEDEIESETPAKAGVSTSEGKGDAATAAQPRGPDGKFVAAAAEPTDDEILAEVPEAARAKVKGRLDAARKAAADAAVTEKAELQKVRSELGRVRAAQGAAKAAPEKKPVSAEAKAELEAFERKYPDLVKGMKALMRTEGGDPENREALLEYVEQKRAEEAVKMAHEEVEKRHPDWINTVNTPAFQTWKGQQSAKVQALAASNDPEDAMILLDLFAPRAPKAKEPTAEEKAAEAKNATEAAQLAAKRKLQKDGAQSPTTKGGASPDITLDPNDGEALFRHYARQSNTRLARSGN